MRRVPEIMLPGVEPVVLPAPVGSTARPPSLAWRALVSVALLVGLFVVAFGIVLGLIGVNVVIFQAGRIIPALAIATVAVVASVARGLAAMVRKPPEPDDEIEVPPHEEPELHDRIRALAQAVGTRPPDRIVVTSEVNAYVREFGPLMGLARGTRTLAIGMPLVDVLTVAQLDAVLAHELGHLAGGDTRLGPLAFRTDQAAQRMIMSLRAKAIASIFVAYWGFQHRVSATVRRGQELIADRAAVRVAGRQAAADALQRIEITARAEALYRQAYLVPLLEAGCRPADLASGLREILVDADRVAELQDEAAGAEVEVDRWATHPPTRERIARVAAVPDAAPVATDDRPAGALWRQADRWAEAAHERWLLAVADGRSDFRPVAWEAFGDETVGRDARAGAGEVDRVLERLGFGPGLDGLRAASTAGRAGPLAGELIALGWRAPGNDERDSIVAHAVFTTALRDALDRGAGRFLFSWSEPLVLADPRGRPLPLPALARGAATGDWDPLHAALIERAPRSGASASVSEAPAVRAPAAGPSVVGPADGPSVPAPPCPPFQRSSGDWLWELELPGHIGTRSRLAIGAESIAFGKAVAAYDDIRSVTMKLEAGADLRATFKLELLEGRPLRLGSGAMGADGQAAIEASFDYLWGLLRLRVGPRLRAAIVAEIEGGSDVKVGNLTLSKAGIAYRTASTKTVPWDRVLDVVLDSGNLHIVTSGKPITRPLASPNAFLLLDLVPELRARYG